MYKIKCLNNECKTSFKASHADPCYVCGNKFVEWEFESEPEHDMLAEQVVSHVGDVILSQEKIDEFNDKHEGVYSLECIDPDTPDVSCFDERGIMIDIDNLPREYDELNTHHYHLYYMGELVLKLSATWDYHMIDGQPTNPDTCGVWDELTHYLTSVPPEALEQIID